MYYYTIQCEHRALDSRIWHYTNGLFCIAYGFTRSILVHTYYSYSFSSWSGQDCVSMILFKYSERSLLNIFGRLDWMTNHPIRREIKIEFWNSYWCIRIQNTPHNKKRTSIETVPTWNELIFLVSIWVASQSRTTIFSLQACVSVIVCGWSYCTKVVFP